MFFTVHPTKIGDMILYATRDHLSRAAFIDSENNFYGGTNDVYCDNELEILNQTKRQLDLYFDGDLKEFSIPLDAQGTVFQRRVWSEIQRIPYGTTIDFSSFSQIIGVKTGTVTRSIFANPIEVIIR